MEILIGFELLGAVELAALSRRVYSKKLSGILFFVATAIAKSAVVALASDPTQRGHNRERIPMLYHDVIHDWPR